MDSDFPEFKPFDQTQLILQKLEDMDKKLDSMRNEMNNRLDQLFECVRKLAAQTANRGLIMPNADIKLPELPLLTSAAVSQFNEQLKNPTFEGQMILRIKSVDKSASINVRVRRFLEALMTYDVAKEYSWTGKSGIADYDTTKIPFNGLLQFQEFIRKALIYGSTIEIDEDSVKMAMHDFFRRVSVRLKSKLKP